MVVDRRGPTLELRELRGIPWRAGEDGPPFLPWDPTVLGASPCPGTSPAARGECVLARGEVEEATRHFLEAMDGPERPWAAVRLGDLALSRDRLEEAIGWWKAAGSTGRFARLAAARLCELTGKCLEGRAFAGLFDPAGLPWPLDLELSLRASRVEAFLGRPGAAVSRILALPSPARAAACGWAKELCRRIALEGLREAEGADREEALAFYLSLPDYHQGPLAVELARSAAEVAKGLGAPVYAGSLLAMVAAAVPPAELAPHLLRAAELFVAGADPVRAAVILDYARTRLPPKELETAPWQRIVSAVAVAASPLAPVGPPAADPDLEYARQILERARGGS